MQRMNLISIILVSAVAMASATLSHAESSPTARRDKALERINACLQRNEVPSRQCKKLNKNIETLVDVYRKGGKSVLPTLFRFTYLTDFYGEALLSDPEGFLTAVAQLPKTNQEAVATGLAGGMLRITSRERFEAIRALLMRSISESQSDKEVAQVCLKALEANNVSLFVNYFPPQTFTGQSADSLIHWYSRDMYMLGEKPLWTPSSNNVTTYRFTYLGAFTGPKAVTLTVQADGTSRLNMKVISEARELSQLDVAIPQDQLARFFTRLDQAHFWGMPTESSRGGKDGAEWILEGVQNGKYHIVVRWCPDIVRQSDEEVAFAEAAQVLFEQAGHRQLGCR
jgi:hypothetical protein